MVIPCNCGLNVPVFATRPTQPTPAAPDDSDSFDVNFAELLRTIDEHFASLPTTQFERLSFELAGVAIEMRRIKNDKDDRFLITAMPGYLPFSIESPERRQAVRTIIDAARGLPNVHFTTDISGKITAGSVFDLAPQMDTYPAFYPLILFLQEARPFIRLIQNYM